MVPVTTSVSARKSAAVKVPVAWRPDIGASITVAWK